MENIKENLSEIETPSLILDSIILKRNIKNMMNFAKKHNINLRPHTKTHKCPEIAKMQLKSGAIGIAVAKVSEAEIMVKAGIKDIQIANEVVDPKKIMKLVSLLENCKITVAVDNKKNVETISQLMKENNCSIDVLVDIDVGLHRCGISYKIPDKIISFIKFINSKPYINFKGILTHAGQVYKSKNIKQVKQIGLFEGREMVKLAKLIRKKGFECDTVSVGSTPTARFAGTVEGVTEIRPGNYIFHDNIQVSMGVADISNCALRVLSSVISIPTKNRVIIDAGSKSLGVEKGKGNLIKGYGNIINKKASIKKLSEEHGFIGNIQNKVNFKLVERIQIIPNHACFTVNLYDKIISFRDGKEFIIEGRGCSQ